MICNRKTRVAMRTEELDLVVGASKSAATVAEWTIPNAAGAAAAHANGTLFGGGVCLLVAWIAASGVRDHGLRA